MSVPDGERVTTGSEPTVAEVVAAVFDLLPAFMSPRPSKEYTTRMVEERFGADEQTEAHGDEGMLAEDEAAAAYWDERRSAEWQPDPRTVAAVVEALRNVAHDTKLARQGHAFADAADFIEERFKPSAPGKETT